MICGRKKNKGNLKESTKIGNVIYENYIQDIIRKRQAGEIAVLITEGHIQPTTALLKIQDSTKNSVAHYFVKFMGEPLPKFMDIYTLLSDPDILKITNKDGDSVAHFISYKRYVPPIFLPIFDREDILMLQNKWGFSVAHGLAHNSKWNGWSTQNKKVLSLQDLEGWSVAHYLADYHPTWTTNDPDIWSIKNMFGETVGKVLKEKGKISS